jgi:integrase
LQLVEVTHSHLKVEKTKSKSEDVKPHQAYVTDWKASMSRGTLTGKAYSPRTIEIYSLYVDKYLVKHCQVSVKGLESELLLIAAKHYAKRDKLWKSLLCFGKYLIRRGALDKGFLEQMKVIQPKRHLPPKRFTVDEQDIPKLIAACDTLQERLIINLLSRLSSTGLRASEACALHWADINFEQGFLVVQCGKGGKTRRVGLSRPLKRMLCQLRTNEARNAQLVFTDRLGKPLVRNGLYQRLERIGIKSGVKVSPHALRRAFVTINTNKGRPLQMLQMACGHSDITTTRSYCLTSEQEVIEAMKGWD